MRSQDLMLQDPKSLFSTRVKNHLGRNLIALVAVKLDLILVYSDFYQPEAFPYFVHDG